MFEKSIHHVGDPYTLTLAKIFISFSGHGASDRERSSYVCWDEASKVAAAGGIDENQLWYSHVEVLFAVLYFVQFTLLVES